MRIKRQLVKEQWNDYCQKILPPNINSIQKQETRRAFYAGAKAILFKIVASFAKETETTKEDLLIMQDVHDELQEFGKSVLRGEA